MIVEHSDMASGAKFRFQSNPDGGNEQETLITMTDGQMSCSEASVDLNGLAVSFFGEWETGAFFEFIERAKAKYYQNIKDKQMGSDWPIDRHGDI